MTAKEQLVKLIGKDDAEKYIQIVKNIMDYESEQQEKLEVVNK